ncbi:alpha-L-Rha alpha-1,3-L-rhamnosyltransferase [Enterococcus florum]|uniref:Alpha-L-Rha alpha-1,3-L-rhamnosyltransferase n=1 Tax=Enterococcus florum TaxID=2480627 RepID=A0A4P5P7K1_9ENTE|nr:glycosyltransferase family 2 protein [Enterococcus florum]GCF93937.1 alpha-L-Rha alpha-1,3-L-rhamnosyltransferase [Enterococcus florum]
MERQRSLSVSICMATYNGAAFIEEQLNSILPQLNNEDELVVSDDASTDGTWELLKNRQMQDQRIKLYRNQGKGVISNFENAMRHCQNAVIFFSDQDDVWKENKIDVMIHYFEKNPEATVVVSDLIIVDNDFKILISSYQEMRKTKTGFWQNLLRSSYIGAGMAFRSDLKKLILPIPDDVPMHDMWIGLLADENKGVMFIPEKLVYYRRHGLNATEINTTASFMQQVKWRWNAWRLVRRRLKEVQKKS